MNIGDREYIVFCDESDTRGRHFSNFYGGVIVGASQYQAATDRLNTLKQELHLFGEIKWAKVTEQYLDRYIELMAGFFREISAGYVRARIMFTQNAWVPPALTAAQREQEYYLLYYQFVKHAFGLRYLPRRSGGVRLRLYFDKLPDTGEKAESFKGYILGLRESQLFRDAGIRLEREDVTEVKSHDHVLLQCLDVVLGSMNFRLNDKHKEKLPGQRVRGKRTRAKEKLYQVILAEIQRIRPGFNIGVNTGLRRYPEGTWEDPYLHWCFQPKDAVYDHTQSKSPHKNNDPT